MLVNLFTAVKGYGVPVTLREFLDLLSALEKKLVFANWEEFSYTNIRAHEAPLHRVFRVVGG